MIEVWSSLCKTLIFGVVRKDFVLMVYAAIFAILECMVNNEWLGRHVANLASWSCVQLLDLETDLGRV